MTYLLVLSNKYVQCNGQLLTYIHILITLILILILTLILIIIQNVQHPGRSVQNRSAHYAGLSSLGLPGVIWPPHILADQLTLHISNGGLIMPTKHWRYPRILDLPTALLWRPSITGVVCMLKHITWHCWTRQTVWVANCLHMQLKVKIYLSILQNVQRLQTSFMIKPS